MLTLGLLENRLSCNCSGKKISQSTAELPQETCEQISHVAMLNSLALGSRGSALTPYVKAERWRPINHQAAQRLVVKGQMVRVFKKENKIFTSSCKKTPIAGVVNLKK